MKNVINSVSFNTAANHPTKQENNNAIESEIKALEQQKSQIQKQIETIKSETMSQKTKDDLAKSLQDQIGQIESQIQQKQTEKVSNVATANIDKKPTSSNNVNKSEDSLLLDNIIVYNNMKNAISLKSALKASSNTLRVEADLDQERDKFHHAGKTIEKKRNKAIENDQRANKIDSEIHKQFKKINENIEKMNDAENEETKPVEDRDEVKKQEGENISSNKIGGEQRTFEDDSISKEKVTIDVFV
jgi:hypothetical protein